MERNISKMDLLTRKQSFKTKKDGIPNSSPNKLIVTASIENYTFNKSCYVQHYIGHILTKEQFDKIIDNLSKKMGQVWVKKKLRDQIKFPNYVLWLSYSSVLLLVVWVILHYISATNDSGNLALFNVSMISLIIASVFVFFIVIDNLRRKVTKFQTFNELLQEELNEEFYKLNKLYQGQLDFYFIKEKKIIEINILKPAEVFQQDEYVDPNLK